MVIERQGKECACGSRGCFERYASMRALKEEVASKMNLKSVTGKELYSILKEPTKEIEEVVDNFIRDLNIGLLNIIRIFEPEAICIGGSFVHFEDLLLEKLKEEMKKNSSVFKGTLPKILLAKMGNDAGMIGATME